MEMPKPTDAHRQLEKLAGSWVGDETMYPSPYDPAGGKAIGRTNSRIGLDGFALIGDYEQERGGMITFRGHSVFTHEEQTGDYVMYWVDSMGMPGETFRGKLDGDVLSLRSHGPHGHFRLSYDLSSPGVLKSRMEMSQDGDNWAKFFDSTLTKAAVLKAAKPKAAPMKKKAPPKKKSMPSKPHMAKKKPAKKAKARR